MAAGYHQSLHGTCQESRNRISEMPKCILGDRCFFRDRELDPEKKPKVEVGDAICSLCRNVSIDKLEQRTVEKPVLDAHRACYKAEELRDEYIELDREVEERRENSTDRRFVCVTKDPEYWAEPWKLNDFDPQSRHECKLVAFSGEMCRPCHERAQEHYPKLKEKFKDGGVFIGFPCVWVDPEYKKEDAKIKPGWQDRNTFFHIDKMKIKSLQGWNIEGEQCHQRVIEEAMICKNCRNGIAKCSIRKYVFNWETFKLNPTWQNDLDDEQLKAKAQPKGLERLERLENYRPHLDTAESTKDAQRRQYDEVNKNELWGEHKVPMRE